MSSQDLVADIRDQQVVLALAHHRDELAAELRVIGYSRRLGFATGAGIVARGAASLALLPACGGARLQDGLAAKNVTSPLLVLIVAGRGKGDIARELELYERLARALAAAADDDARRTLLAEPVGRNFYSELPGAHLGGRLGVYSVASAEHAVRGSRAADAAKSAAFQARASGGLGNVAPGDFKQKVGCGTEKRGKQWAHPKHPPHWLFALTHSITASTGAEDAHGRNVLLGAEALITLVHAPVAPRLPGVGMFGEPSTDRAAAQKAAKIAIARAAHNDTSDMTDEQLESAGAAAMGEWPCTGAPLLANALQLPRTSSAGPARG
jgi:hypothetical protein